MSNTGTNPLYKHFRQPAIYLKLPSQGRFYPPNCLDLPVTNEIPVYPMTVKDELTLKTPDALMNGTGMCEVVKSCCPNILDPWCVPAVDLDAIFIAIRLASYGSTMDFTSVCPSCKTQNENSVDLRVLLDRLKTANYSDSPIIDNLKFKFKPQTYKSINEANLITFEEQRIVNSIVLNETLSETEKLSKFNESFAKLKNMNITVVAASIESIMVEDGTVVTDQQQICEFLDNCSRQVYEEIKQHIERLVEVNRLEKLSLTCESCEKTYNSELTFDQANFFA